MVEPFFYVGTGAYDFQYLDLANDKYSYDADWIASNAGLTVGLMVSAARQLQDLREHRFLELLQASTHDARCKAALATFSFNRDDVGSLSDSEFESFINVFAVTPGGVKRPDKVGSVNELEFKPIIRLAGDCFFMPVGFMLAKAIYESPFYWMTRDTRYATQGSNNRGRVAEEIAHKLLSSVFGDKVYRNVVIPDHKKTICEIDVLAVVGNRALVVQAKAKRLTALARQGDDGQIKEDFSLAVQEAYEQGLISRRLLLDGQHKLTDHMGNAVDISTSLEDVYILCLTLDHFPALPYMTELFLEKQVDDPYAIAMSVFDLDILADYLVAPLDFMHYIYQRSRWFGQVHGSCEVSFLGYYLNQGLAVPPEVSGVTLTEEMAGLIDVDFPLKRGRNQLLAELLGIDLSNIGSEGLKNRWQSNTLHHFIRFLESSPHPKATDAVFMLLDLSQEVALYLEQQILEAMYECSRTEEICGGCISLQDGSGISFVWIPKLTVALQDVVHDHAAAYKYKHKCDRWLGLGGTLVGSGVSIVFNTDPWHTDMELDDLARLLLHPETQGRKPGRNQPCWCGSGQKYKRCHL